MAWCLLVDHGVSSKRRRELRPGADSIASSDSIWPLRCGAGRRCPEALHDDVGPLQVPSLELLAQDLLDSLPIQVAIIDWRGTILQVNEAWQRFGEENGASPADIAGVGRDYLEVCRTAVRAGCREAAQFLEGFAALQLGETEGIEVDYPCHSPQRQRWFKMKACSVHGSPQLTLVMHVDVTCLKLAEKRAVQMCKAFEVAEQEKTLLLNSMDDLVLFHDLELSIRWANQTAERSVNAAPGTLVGRHCYEVWHGRTEPCDECPVMLALKTGTAQEGEVRSPNGSYWSIRGYPIRDQQGELTGVLEFCLDITARKRAEELLLEADRRKDEFLATLAHELRNPLAPIRNAVEILHLTRAADAGVQRPLQIIDRQVGQLARLLDDLLDLSRISRGKIRVQREPLDLRDVVERAIETVGPTLAQQEMQLVYQRAEERCELSGDATRLEQVICNLLNNAAKYSPRGKRIWLELGTEALGTGGERMAVLRIRDEGMGIEPAMLQRIFEPFAQGSQPANRTRSGLGIGLTLVRRLVELHGGRVEAASAGAGRGSTFTVLLPLGEGGQTLALPIPCPRTAGPSLRTSDATRSLSVLVVEDVPDAAASLAEMLDLWGHTVSVAHDGAEALARAVELQPEVVLLDIGLPGMDGYEVARRLRSIPFRRAPTIVAVTGFGAVDDRQRARDSGFAHHLTKPIDLGELRALLARMERDRS